MITVGSSMNANDRLALRITPSVAFAPANLVVHTTIEANNKNRTLQVVADSPEFYRSSETELDGENAPRTVVFEFRSVPSGDYTVRAMLRDARGDELTSAQSQVSVMSSGFAP